MEPLAKKIYLENLGKNFVNSNEYKQSIIIEQGLSISIANLLGLKNEDEIFSKSMVGSSEAIGMAILIHKLKWESLKTKDSKPNIVFCNNVHLSWYKFAQYFSIEIREVKVKNNDSFPFAEYLSK